MEVSKHEKKKYNKNNVVELSKKSARMGNIFSPGVN